MEIDPISRKSRSPRIATKNSLRPVHVWAGIGTFQLAILGYFTVKWIFSDHFLPVSPGPDLPPEWMRMALDIGQVVMTSALLISFCWFVVRPWIRERHLTTDGLILIGCCLASIWDLLSNTGQYWFTYNSYLVNRGPILGVMPTPLSPHAPGVSEAWPVFIHMLYGNFVVVTILMCALMRYVKNRWPHTGTLPLVALCLVLGAIADFIIEGLVLLPLGFWTYAGGHIAVNADKYY